MACPPQDVPERVAAPDPRGYRAATMSVTNEQVRHIAKLARIAMSDDELERLVPELNNILGWVEQLSEVNTDGIEQIGRASCRERV